MVIANDCEWLEKRNERVSSLTTTKTSTTSSSTTSTSISINSTRITSNPHRIISKKTMSLLALLTVSGSRRSIGGNVVRALSTSTISSTGTCFQSGNRIQQRRTASEGIGGFAGRHGWHRTVGFSTESGGPSSSSTPIVATAATVEDDLDSALDDILGSVFKEAGDPVGDSIEMAVDDAVSGAADLSVNTDDGTPLPTVDETIIGITDPKKTPTTSPPLTPTGQTLGCTKP